MGNSLRTSGIGIREVLITMLKYPPTLHVNIGNECFWNLVRTGGELVNYWETMGYLIGRRCRNVIDVVNLSPIHTAAKGTRSVSYGNTAARKRYKIINDAITQIAERRGKQGYKLIGQFHCHAGPSEEYEIGLNEKDDLGFIEDELQDFGMYEWLEIITFTNMRKYTRRRGVEEELKVYPRRLKIIVRNEYFGFHTRIAGFWIYKDSEYKKQGRIRPRFRCKEIPVRFPSWRSQ